MVATRILRPFRSFANSLSCSLRRSTMSEKMSEMTWIGGRAALRSAMAAFSAERTGMTFAF